MTDSEFFKGAIGALDRLNPPMLSSGGFVNKCVPCAIGAYFIAQHDLKRRVEPDELQDLANDLYEVHRSIYYDKCVSDMIKVNEHFHPDDNRPKVMKARFKHVRKWLAAQISATA